MKFLKTLFMLLIVAAISVSCAVIPSVKPTDVPDDFEFSIRWNVYGVSSYDSESGVLIKTTDVIERSPNDYKTTLILSAQQWRQIYGIIKSLDIESYPDEYDPYLCEDGTSRMSKPFRTIILTVNNKTVACRGIALGGDVGGTDMGTRFLESVSKIVKILTSTEQWNALPDYEVLYS